MIKNNNFLSQPLVSVIVPTYNGAKRIARTLQSIIEQDYENLEIIVVDDVSTDNTVEVAQKVLEDSGRNFQLIKRSVNGHQSAARNTGFKASRGK
ncbi:MAG: glycosyltransferase family 2 protein, partial [Synergistaceae bacterium]|nr:glycosyltransferase family 2 protein [Synergistaceae bacterium]